MDKTFPSAQAALADVVKDGMTVLAGGFGLCGIPEHSIAALRALNPRDLTIVSNNCGVDGKGLGILLENGQVKKMISSYVGENKTFARLFLSGELAVELCPQGTLAERLRAGGSGIPAFFTATGYGTVRADGRETRMFTDASGGERGYVLEEAITGDVAIVKAWKADRWGNLVYRRTARNFNPLCAAAGRITIAEVEELVEVGQIDPDSVHTPGIFVHRVVVGGHYDKPIEQRTTRARS